MIGSFKIAFFAKDKICSITLKGACDTEYMVNIPNGVEFSKFLADDLIAKPSTAQYGYWITGFKSQTEAMIGSA